MKFIILILAVFVNVFSIVNKVKASVDIKNTNGRLAFDQSLYENALDPDLCKKQLEAARNDTLVYLQFLESGLRIPRGITLGNMDDLGNYPQCLGIDKDINNVRVEGKYCSIAVPFNQSLNLPSFPSFPTFPDWPEIDRPDWLPDEIQWPDWLPLPDDINLPEWIIRPELLQFKIDEDVLKRLRDGDYKKYITVDPTLATERAGGLAGLPLNFNLAVCVPKACTVREGMNGLLFNTTALGFQYSERYCRLPNDKPWVPGDYVFIVIFSTLGLITMLSTCYDVYQRILLETDPKSISTLYTSFSVYTNTRRLLTFRKVPGTLECLDGIRTLAMLWVIVGHTFITLPPLMNGLDAFEWLLDGRSFWVTTSLITVDTFFMLSGLLLVYTAANKLTGIKLLKNLHLFYLNRLLRMFPLLAACILFDVSFFHRVFDGPNWGTVAEATEDCRRNWWITLLYLQNILNPLNICIPHSWYLAVDMQLHILSPLILFFVLGRKKKIAWSALIATLLAVITGTAIYVFLNDFNGHTVVANTNEERSLNYYRYYYINTLTRASPFFVGMIYGYILHLYRENKLEISKPTALVLWICAFSLTSLAIYASEPLKDFDFSNRTVSRLINTFQRPGWAVGLGWIILACVHGYGGPINWFLSLEMWKLPSRISYAMYLLHYPLMFVIAGSSISTYYFTVDGVLYEFCARLFLTFIISFVATLIIDSPFSTLFKLLLGGGPKPKREEKKENLENQNDPEKFKNRS